MQKLYLTMLLLSICNGIAAMENTTIKLASAQELNKRLCNKGFEHFIEKTKIDNTLGDQERYPMGVVMAVELALYDYNKDLGNPMMFQLMQMRKPEIIETILDGHPKAIEGLKQQGLLK